LKVDQLRTKRAVGLSRYSYVSLFGINSLDGLRAGLKKKLSDFSQL
jgi:hypothetical protein